jgi:hypothetical protein
MGAKGFLLEIAELSGMICAAIFERERKGPSVAWLRIVLKTEADFWTFFETGEFYKAGLVLPLENIN